MKFELNNNTGTYPGFNTIISTMSSILSVNASAIFYGLNSTSEVDIAQAIFLKNKIETFIVEVDFRGNTTPAGAPPTGTQFATDHPTAINVYINGTVAP